MIQASVLTLGRSAGQMTVAAIILLIVGHDIGDAQEATGSKSDRYEQSQIHMGTSFRIVFYAPSEAHATKAFEDAFARIAGLEQCLSDYRDDSELTLFCQSPPSTPVAISNDLWRVLDRGQKLAKDTGGAFDMTCGPAVRLWRRGRRLKEIPSPERIEGVLSRIGYQHLTLDPDSRSATLGRADMRLDLGGIAKGFTVDEVLGLLQRIGIDSAMVVGGGEIAVGDPPPGKSGWSIAINEPGETDRVQEGYLSLCRCAVSTSGDAAQFLEIEGRRFSHIIDPRTGNALEVRRQATVIAADGMTADAVASALCVLGPDGAEELLKTTGARAGRIDEFGTKGWTRWTSSGWIDIPSNFEQ